MQDQSFKNATAPSVLTVDLSAIAANYRDFKVISDAAVAGVVKADAYGLGVVPVFQTLLREGCRHFFVATPEEAMALRALDETSQIMVLGGLYEGAEEFYAGRGIIPVLNTMDEVARWSKTASLFARKLPAVLHFDTGMNRLGLSPEDRPDTDALDLRLIMSHFASSDEKASPLNDRQAAAFDKIAAAYPGISKSLANSSGLFRKSAWHHDLVRPGYALYGGNPTPEMKNPVRPVVTLKTRILQTRAVRKGSSAGYNASHVFSQNTTTATVALGYADGFLRSASNRAKLYWGDQPCPIVGRVSMDLIIVETGHLDFPPREGDWLEVLGQNQDIDRLARDTGTIGYEILTSLGPRHHRVYES